MRCTFDAVGTLGTFDIVGTILQRFAPKQSERSERFFFVQALWGEKGLLLPKKLRF